MTGATEARPHTFVMLTLALLTRSLTLLFVVQRFPHMWLYSRGIELGTLAQSLVAGHGLSSPFGGSRPADRASVSRLPRPDRLVLPHLRLLHLPRGDCCHGAATAF